MAKIKLTVEELEVILTQHKAQIIFNIKSTLGSTEPIQIIRNLQREGKIEKMIDFEDNLFSSIENIAHKTGLPNEIQILKKYLSNGKN